MDYHTLGSSPFAYFKDATVRIDKVINHKLLISVAFDQVWPIMLKKWRAAETGVPKDCKVVLFTEQVEHLHCQLNSEGAHVSVRTTSRAHIREVVEAVDELTHLVFFNPSVEIIHMVRSINNAHVMVHSLKTIVLKPWLDQLEVTHKVASTLQYRHLDFRAIQVIGPVEKSNGPSVGITLLTWPVQERHTSNDFVHTVPFGTAIAGRRSAGCFVTVGEASARIVEEFTAKYTCSILGSWQCKIGSDQLVSIALHGEANRSPLVWEELRLALKQSGFFFLMETVKYKVRNAVMIALEFSLFHPIVKIINSHAQGCSVVSAFFPKKEVHLALDIAPEDWECLRLEVLEEMSLDLNEQKPKRFTVEQHNEGWVADLDQPGALREVAFFIKNMDTSIDLGHVIEAIADALGHNRFKFSKIAYENKAGKCVARYVFSVSMDFVASVGSLFDTSRTDVIAGWAEDLSDQPMLIPFGINKAARDKISQWEHVTDAVAEGARLGEEVLVRACDIEDQMAVSRCLNATYALVEYKKCSKMRATNVPCSSPGRGITLFPTPPGEEIETFHEWSSKAVRGYLEEMAAMANLGTNIDIRRVRTLKRNKIYFLWCTSKVRLVLHHTDGLKEIDRGNVEVFLYPGQAVLTPSELIDESKIGPGITLYETCDLDKEGEVNEDESSASKFSSVPNDPGPRIEAAEERIKHQKHKHDFFKGSGESNKDLATIKNHGGSTSLSYRGDDFAHLGPPTPDGIPPGQEIENSQVPTPPREEGNKLDKTDKPDGGRGEVKKLSFTSNSDDEEDDEPIFIAQINNKAVRETPYDMCYVAAAFRFAAIIGTLGFTFMHVGHALTKAFGSGITQTDSCVQAQLVTFLNFIRPFRKGGQDDSLGIVRWLMEQIPTSVAVNLLPTIETRMSCRNPQCNHQRTELDKSGVIPGDVGKHGKLDVIDEQFSGGSTDRDRCPECQWGIDGNVEHRPQESKHIQCTGNRIIVSLNRPISPIPEGGKSRLTINQVTKEYKVLAQLMYDGNGNSGHYIVQQHHASGIYTYDPTTGAYQGQHVRCEDFRVIALIAIFDNALPEEAVCPIISRGWAFYKKNILPLYGQTAVCKNEQAGDVKSSPNDDSQKRYALRPKAKRPAEEGTTGEGEPKDGPHPEIAVGIVSLFDGTSTAITCVEQVFGHKADATITAEIIPSVRAIVADLHGYEIGEPRWALDKRGRLNLYLPDVWEIMHQHALPLRNLVQLLKNAVKKKKLAAQMSKRSKNGGGMRIFLVAGSPCQNLTTHNEEFGALGVTGPSSVFIHVIPVILMVLKAIEPDIPVFLIMENAGSMLRGDRPIFLGSSGPPPANFASYILCVTGLRHKRAEKYMQASSRGALVTRNRTFFTSADGFQTSQDAVQQPWDPGWVSPFVKKGSSYSPKTKMPWLRSRGVAGHDGVLVQTFGAYSPWNLLYKAEFWGGEAKFAEVCLTVAPIAWVDWRNFLGDKAYEAIEILLKHEAHATSTGRFFPSKTQAKVLDECALTIALAMKTKEDENLPFRLPSKEEKLKESELQDYFHQVGVTKPLLTEEVVSNLIGNFFKPSIVRAAIQGADGMACSKFMDGDFSELHLPIAPSIQDIEVAYREIRDVTARYVKAEFPASLGKIQDTWHPRSIPITTAWLEKIGRHGPTSIIGYKPKPAKVSAQQVQALLGTKKRKVPDVQPESSGAAFSFPEWLAKCLSKTIRAKVSNPLEKNIFQTTTVAEAMRETMLLTALDTNGALFHHRTLIDELSEVGHPVDAVTIYDRLARITTIVKEALIVHISGCGSQQTLISVPQGKANVFVLLVDTHSIRFVQASEDTYSDRQYAELMGYLKVASHIQHGPKVALEKQIFGSDHFIWAELEKKQAVIICWNEEGVLCVGYHECFWYTRGPIVDTIVAAFGIWQQCKLGLQEEAQSSTKPLNMHEAICDRVQAAVTSDEEAPPAVPAFLRGTGASLSSKEYFLPNKRIDGVNGVTLAIDTDRRVAFWCTGRPPGEAALEYQ